ncbi:MAG: sulfatase, partial [Planctomycetota bacterium]
HGDHDAAHKLEHKSILYEEAARIPLLMRWPGHLPSGRLDREHLVSNGLDLIPTLCDAAGIEPPDGLLGRSALPVAKGETVPWRDHLVVETKCGRMLRSARYKYVVYDSGRNREQLFDLDADPHETRSLAAEPQHKATLEQHRRLLRDWVNATDDKIAAAYVL